MKEKIRRHFELNDYRNTTCEKVLGIGGADLRRKFIGLNA